MTASDDDRHGAAPTGARNIVLLSDGTGNSAAKINKTNVWRLYQALELRGGDQLACYDDGVGTSGFKPLAVLGGAFGYGLARNVRDLYAFLCQHYRDGDRIYIFGFSRGAFTARVLADFIATRGLLRPEDMRSGDAFSEAVYDAYRQYRRSYRSGVMTVVRALRDWGRRDAPPGPIPPIEFVGVWDTVDAVGLPMDELSDAWNALVPHRFPDRNLSPRVVRACHAISLDDERHTFHPVLWNESGETSDRIQQVWFAGVHSNVGGGYPDDDLASASLDWMMGHCEARDGAPGLRFDPVARRSIAARAQPLGKLYDSRSGAGIYYRYKPRHVFELCNDERNHVAIGRPKVHDSVLQRIASEPAGYAPAGLPRDFEVVRSRPVLAPDGRAGGESPAPGPAVVETGEQAAVRSALLDRVPAHVFWQRLVYLAMVYLTVGAVTLPHYLPPVPNRVPADTVSKAVAWPLAFSARFLPEFSGYWIDGWSQSPRYFLLLVAGALVLWLFRRRIDARVRRLSELAWWHLKHRAPRPEAPPPGPFERLARAIMASHALGWAYRATSQRVLPMVAFVAVMAVVAGAVVRLTMFSAEASGGVCARAAVPSAGPVALAGSVVLDAKNPCLDTRVELRAGERYRLSVQVVQPLVDGDGSRWHATPAGLSGFFSRFHPVFLLGLPHRRHVSLPWFALTGEIGRDSGRVFPIPETLEFEAPATGVLHLYVNDAVNSFYRLGRFAPKPLDRSWRDFYQNNHGEVQVTVEHRP